MTRVVAHRAVSPGVPENSLAGVRAAAVTGADLVEVDVRLTRDGVPVLLHDRTAWRTGRWPVPVRWTSSARIGRVTLADGSTVPTLGAAATVLPSGVGLALDLKDPAAGRAVARLTLPAGSELWCRDPAALDELGGSGRRRALLRDTASEASTRRLLADAVACRADAVSVAERVLSVALVREAADRGVDVYCWVRARDRLAAALATGLAAVVTDWPADARRLVGPRVP